MKSRAIALCLVFGAATALSACSSDDSSSVSDTKATFCQSLVDVKQSETAIADLNAKSTVDDAVDTPSRASSPPSQRRRARPTRCSRRTTI